MDRRDRNARMPGVSRLPDQPRRPPCAGAGLDEPTIGLHARDNLRLLDTLEALREKGNSLVVVEHDEETMRRADHIVDLGPHAGVHGGEVVATGTMREIMRAKNSETGKCLKSPLRHPKREARRSLRTVEDWIEIRGATANNLKNRSEEHTSEL